MRQDEAGTMNWMSLLGLDTKVARARSNLSELAIAAEDRWELARLEWAGHRSAIVRLGLLLLALVCVGTVAMVAVTLAALVQFWDTPWRVVVAWGVAGAWVLAAVLLWLRMQYWMQSLAGLFALTRAELARDWQTLKEPRERDEA